MQDSIERRALNNQLVDAARKNRYMSPIFFLVFGLLFLGVAVHQWITVGFESIDWLLWGIGGFFLLFGVITLFRVARMLRKTN